MYAAEILLTNARLHDGCRESVGPSASLKMPETNDPTQRKLRRRKSKRSGGMT
jgi:hypothetical protein